MTPSATPGKMYALLPWPVLYVFPSYLTGGNGDPEQYITLP